MINIAAELKNCFSFATPAEAIDTAGANNTEFKNSIPSSIDCFIEIPKELSFFHGHFPNSPVLPAVGMIDINEYLLRQSITSPFVISELSKMKIKSPVKPNDKIKIQFEITDSKVECIWTLQTSTEPQNLIAQITLKVQFATTFNSKD